MDYEDIGNHKYMKEERQEIKINYEKTLLLLSN
jgi:hypothetical protein